MPIQIQIRQVTKMISPLPMLMSYILAIIPFHGLLRSRKLCKIFNRSGIQVSSECNNWAQMALLFLTDLDVQLPCCLVLYCDNVGDTQLCSNSCFTPKWNMLPSIVTSWGTKYLMVSFALHMYPQQINLLMHSQVSSSYPFSTFQIQDWTSTSSSIFRGHIITQWIATGFNNLIVLSMLNYSNKLYRLQ